MKLIEDAETQRKGKRLTLHSSCTRIRLLFNQTINFYSITEVAYMNYSSSFPIVVGGIFITWYHNLNVFDGFSIRGKSHARVSICIPARFGALHACIPEQKDLENSSLSKNGSSSHTATPSKIIKSMVALSIGQKNRSKLRFHAGAEYASLLSSFLFSFPFSSSLTF